MAEAVSRLSPVIITTWMPAPRISETALRASGRTSSRMPIRPIRIRLPGMPPVPTGVSDTASASTAHGMAGHLLRFSDGAGTRRQGDAPRHFRRNTGCSVASRRSGAPLIRTSPSRGPPSSRTAEYFRALSKGMRSAIRHTSFHPPLFRARIPAEPGRWHCLPGPGLAEIRLAVLQTQESSTSSHRGR